MSTCGLNVEGIKSWLKDKLSGNVDVEYRKLSSATNIQAELLFIKSLCDSKIINKHVIEPLFGSDNVESYELYLNSVPGGKQFIHLNDALHQLLMGYLIVFINTRIFILDTKKIESSSINEASVESVVQGPRDAFIENIETNINLIRHRYCSADLQTQLKQIGSISKTRVVILYDKSKVEDEILEDVRMRLDNIKVELLQSASEVEKLLTPQKFRMFPTMLITERPDRAVKNLAEGKIIIAVDGTPFVIVIPSVFDDFFAAMDDKYQLPIVGIFLKCIRYFGLLITFSLPAFYIAFSSYNPEILRVQLTLLIAGSRASVPYPSFIEVVFMLLMMEFLIEASLRLPKAIGPTATTVGGLILGQAATEAGLVGNIMIILVSAVAISNFVIPINMMSFSVRVIKYIFVLLAAIFGLVGIVLGVIASIMYLSNLRSFGKPYFKAFNNSLSNHKGSK